MAPSKRNSRREEEEEEEELITTISDDDEITDEEEEEIEAAESDLETAPRSKNNKRKRDDAIPSLPSASSKKPKTSQPANGTTTPSTTTNGITKTSGKPNGTTSHPAAEDGQDRDPDFNTQFEFGLDDASAPLGDFEGWAAGSLDLVVGSRGNKGGLDVEGIIARRREKVRLEQGGDEEEGEDEVDEEAEEEEDEDEGFDGFGAGADLAVGSEDGEGEDHDQDDDDDEDEDEDGDVEDEDVEAAPQPPSDDDDDNEEDVDEAEEAKRNAFFAPESETQPTAQRQESFLALSISRPLLKGLADMRFNVPTPIQAKTIPIALEGKDVVGGAVTGSGKTAAFVLPILERLLFRVKRPATTRVVILAPTRELAMQCFHVAQKLARHTDITFGQAIGGMNLREQEKQLRLRPDIVIATPGRFIDLERNSNCLALNTIEILVLDEADRMLEEGFADELNEILTKIPKTRQTMLFSATMTSKVDDLIRVGLRRPVRVMVDAQKATVSGLVQEFIRLRSGRDTQRLGYLMHLCTEIYHDRTIVFFRQKKDVHKIRIIFALLGLQAAELHGSMTQQQRLDAIDAFRTGRARFLLATDLASRGLDIKGIDAVINYEAPQSHEIYLHRVGRTARAGRSGRACTLAAEPDRRVVKAALKAARSQGAVVRTRTVAPADADAWQAKCDALDAEIEDILREEREEKVLATTERDLTRAENIVAHKDEILARPKKTWFESEKDKAAAKQRGAEALNGVDGEGEGRKAAGKKKLSNKQKKTMLNRDERKEGNLWKKGKSDRERKGPISKGPGAKKGGKVGKSKGKK